MGRPLHPEADARGSGARPSGSARRRRLQRTFLVSAGSASRAWRGGSPADLTDGEVRLGARIAALDLARRRVGSRPGRDRVRRARLHPAALLGGKAHRRPADVLEEARKLRSVGVTVVEIGADDAGGSASIGVLSGGRSASTAWVAFEVNPRLAPRGCAASRRVLACWADRSGARRAAHAWNPCTAWVS